MERDVAMHAMQVNKSNPNEEIEILKESIELNTFELVICIHPYDPNRKPGLYGLSGGTTDEMPNLCQRHFRYRPQYT